MALTKISRGLLSTGISDSSDATAITINSSEDVLINGTQEYNSLNGRGNLVVGSGSGNEGITIVTGTSNTGGITFADGTSGDAAYRGQLEYSHSADAMTFVTAATERMRMDSSGNVGIGTTSMDGDLHVMEGSAGSVTANGGANIAIFEGSGNKGISILTPDANSAAIFFGSPSDAVGARITWNYDDNLMAIGPDKSGASFRFNSGDGAEGMRIASTGQVFVGRTSSVDAGLFIVSANPSTYNHITTIPEANASYNALTMTDYVGNRLGAISVGTTGSSAITYGNSSDYRLKENIVPMEKGIERVNKLKPVKFDWKDSGVSSEGFIAHEIQEAGWVLGVTGEKDDEEMQMVEYGKLTPLLVKAIQEQQTQIEALQSEINTLKGGD